MSLEEALQGGGSDLGPSENDEWDDVQPDPELSDGPQSLRVQQIEHKTNKKAGTRLNILLTSTEGDFQGVFHSLNLPFEGQSAQARKFCLMGIKEFAVALRLSLPPSKTDANVIAEHAIENWTNAEGTVTVATEIGEYNGKETRNKVLKLPRLKG